MLNYKTFVRLNLLALGFWWGCSVDSRKVDVNPLLPDDAGQAGGEQPGVGGSTFQAPPTEAPPDLGLVPSEDAATMTAAEPACADGACDGGTSGGSLLSALGEPCADAVECESNFCSPDVDNFTRCCDRSCGEQACERCSLDGTCGGVAPVFAAECAEVACPVDDVCRDFQQAIAAGTCVDAARCSALSDCTFEWTSVAREGQACVCDDASCSLAPAEPCTRNEDCRSGACRATLAGTSLCCAQACGVGQVCRADGSGCELEPVCTNGQLRCSAASYQQCMGGQWVTQRECGALGCDVALGGCRRSAGETCTTSSDCGEGACRDTANGGRVCCTAACDTACRRCAATGTACQSLTDDAACGAIVCPADSTCRDFPQSVAANRCRSGSCGSPAELCTFTSRNAGQACSGVSLCDNAGNCSVPKGGLGDDCSNADQCASNQCVTGACCESACNGPNQSCATGECLCTGGLDECDEACFDLNASRAHCGACDQPCLGGQCLTGVCRPIEIAAGSSHTCVILPNLGVRCWGSGLVGELGFGNTNDIGDNETPASAGFVSAGGTVVQLAAGGGHTCALLSTRDVRCWGTGGQGRLGYGNTTNIGDTELPSSVGTVSLGGPVAQVVAGSSHTCALLTTGAVRCWGGASQGALGYGNVNNIGDTELPSSVGPVNVGGSVVQLAAGGSHTCALLDTGAVRCWGGNTFGQLGYGNTTTIGDTETPASAGSVNVGGTVVHLTAGLNHTCALLDTGAVRCWGRAFSGELGYGNTESIGDTETPASAGSVNIGASVASLDAGGSHNCAVLTTGAVRCWGAGGLGQLGYGNTTTIGDTETPASAGSVNVGGTVSQVTVGDAHTCALLSTGVVRCWGFGAVGSLGYGNTTNIGDTEAPTVAGNLVLR